MRRNISTTTGLALALMLGSVFSGLVPSAKAETANGPSLLISQLKITSSSGQFVTLYNSTNAAVDMSKYQLEYFNNYDLGKASSSRLIALSGTVPPHGYYMVNDDTLLLCYQMTVDSVSLGFSSTAGQVQVLALGQSSPGAPATPVLQDYVGWSKTAASGAQTLPSNSSAFLQRLPVDSQNNPAVTAPGAGSWQVVQSDPTQACGLVSAGTSSPVNAGLSQLLPAAQPSATIVSEIESPGTDPAPGLPAADIGLMAPQITELLPNPTGTGNDSTDEYIELYNPNTVSFDLSGFKLETGLTSLHDYTFPDGTSLPPHSFVSFYSATTGLTLSNTGSVAKLVDPMGNSISATPPYTGAKDSQAWSLAKGKWYWTTAPTPGLANVIKQPPATKKTKRSVAAAAKTGPSKAVASKSPKAKSAKTTGGSGYAEAVPTSPVHVGVLVLVGSLALLYGIYEYRVDIANRYHQLRGYLRARRQPRPQATRWRADRAKG